MGLQFTSPKSLSQRTLRSEGYTFRNHISIISTLTEESSARDSSETETEELIAIIAKSNTTAKNNNKLYNTGTTPVTHKMKIEHWLLNIIE